MSRRTAIILFVGLSAVYLAAVNDSWAIKPDSALYLSLGRSLTEGRGMEFNGGQWWAIPPVVPLLIAACRLVEGEHYVLVNLIMTLLGLGIVAVTAATVRRLAEGLPEAMHPHVAVAAVLVVGLSARLFVDSTLIMTDVPFTLFVSIAIYSFVRGRDKPLWFLAGGAALVAATYTRLPGVLFAAGLVAAALADLRPEGYARRALAAIACGAVVLAAFIAWFFLIRTRGDPGTIDYWNAVTAERVNVLAPSRWPILWESLTHIPGALCGSLMDQKLEGLHFNLVPTASLLVGLATLARRRQWVVLVPAVLYVGLLVALAPQSVAPRYFLPVMPILAYGLLVGFQTLSVWLGRLTRRPAQPGWALAAAVVFCLGVSAPKIVREVYRMRHPQFYSVYEDGQWRDVRRVCAALAERGRPETDKVVTTQPSIVHYLSRLRVEAGPPLWPSEGPRAYRGIPPEKFAESVARGPWRFVVIPADTPQWSEPAKNALGASGAFLPAEPFGRMVLFERLPTRG
jgi:4-amino-4-deoxy-L-arabinose transferase-like glycosyltransferase